MQKEKQKELERRKVGQDVQKLKRWQQDQELKCLLEERDKEKKDKEAARQRVLAQIAQDREERAAKWAKQAKRMSPPSTPQPIPRAIPINTEIARLQFRLPDSTSHTHDFPSRNTLQVFFSKMYCFGCYFRK